MQPDLIIISGRQSDYKEELAKSLQLPLFSCDTKEPWESLQQNVTALGEIFGKQDKAKNQLATLSNAIDETKEKARSLTKQL